MGEKRIDEYSIKPNQEGVEQQDLEWDSREGDPTAGEKIMTLWRTLPTQDKEQVMVELLRGTDIGRRIVTHGLLSTPHYMWDRKSK